MLHCGVYCHSKAVLELRLESTPKIVERRIRIPQVIEVFQECHLQLVAQLLRKANYSRAIRSVGILGKSSRLKIQDVLHAVDCSVKWDVSLMQNPATKS